MVKRPRAANSLKGSTQMDCSTVMRAVPIAPLRKNFGFAFMGLPCIQERKKKEETRVRMKQQREHVTIAQKEEEKEAQNCKKVVDRIFQD
jgi:hypothetical protein